MVPHKPARMFSILQWELNTRDGAPEVEKSKQHEGRAQPCSGWTVIRNEHRTRNSFLGRAVQGHCTPGVLSAALQTKQVPAGATLPPAATPPPHCSENAGLPGRVLAWPAHPAKLLSPCLRAVSKYLELLKLPHSSSTHPQRSTDKVAP